MTSEITNKKKISSLIFRPIVHTCFCIPIKTLCLVKSKYSLNITPSLVLMHLSGGILFKLLTKQFEISN